MGVRPGAQAGFSQSADGFHLWSSSPVNRSEHLDSGGNQAEVDPSRWGSPDPGSRRDPRSSLSFVLCHFNVLLPKLAPVELMSRKRCARLGGQGNMSTATRQDTVDLAAPVPLWSTAT